MNGWERVDAALKQIAKQRGALDVEEARWLREAIRVKIWREVGCVSLVDYLERRLGYAPRTAHDRVRVAMALAELPRLEKAMASGLPHSAVREITRVATPETEQQWLDDCRGKSVHEIERRVAGHPRGALPGDPKQQDLVGRTVPFEGIRPATIALIRDARRMLQTERGSEPFSDDDLLSAFARAVLAGGTAEPTRAPYQVSVTVCEQCGAGWQTSGGRDHALSRADVERACCDAERIGSLDADDPARAAQDVPPRIRRFIFRRDGGRCRVPGCRSTRCLELHHLVPRSEGGTHDAENLILSCDGCHASHHRGLISFRGTASALVVERTRPVVYNLDDSDPGTHDVTSVDQTSTDTEQSAHVGANAAQLPALSGHRKVDGESSCGAVNSSTDVEQSAHVGTNAPQLDGGAGAQARPERDVAPIYPLPSRLEREKLRAEARAALIGLGFRRAEAGKAVDVALSRLGATAALEAVIREALRSCAGT